MNEDNLNGWEWEKLITNYVVTLPEPQKESWATIDWAKNSNAYRSYVQNTFGTIRMFGIDTPVAIWNKDIEYLTLHENPKSLSHLYLDPKTPQVRHFLQAYTRDLFEINRSNKIKLLDLLSQSSHIMILGRPGTGKSTICRMIMNHYSKCNTLLPVFIAVKSLIHTDLTILDYIGNQLKDIGIPLDTNSVNYLLYTGSIILIVDDLNLLLSPTNSQNELVYSNYQFLQNFGKLYPKAHAVFTCRSNSVDYSFPQFHYAETSSTSKEFEGHVVAKWFSNNPDTQPDIFASSVYWDNHGDLPQTNRHSPLSPLLVAMYCYILYNKTEPASDIANLPTQAVKLLLENNLRNQQKNTSKSCTKLSSDRVWDILEVVAYATYIKPSKILKRTELVELIMRLLFVSPTEHQESAPEIAYTLIDILVNTFHILSNEHPNEYAFTDNMIHECITANYIIHQQSTDELVRLFEKANTPMWHEIIYIAVMHLDNVGWEVFVNTINDLINTTYSNAEPVTTLLNWAAVKADEIPLKLNKTSLRNFYIWLALHDIGIPALLDNELNKIAFVFDTIITRRKFRFPYPEIDRNYILNLVFDEADVIDFNRVLAQNLNYDGFLEIAVLTGLGRFSHELYDSELTALEEQRQILGMQYVSDEALARAADTTPHALYLDYCLWYLINKSKAFVLAGSLDNTHLLKRTRNKDLLLNYALACNFDFNGSENSPGLVQIALDHVFEMALKHAIYQTKKYAEKISAELYNELDQITVPETNWHEHKHVSQSQRLDFLNDVTSIATSYRAIGIKWEFTQNQLQKIKEMMTTTSFYVKCILMKDKTRNEKEFEKILLPDITSLTLTGKD